MQALGVDLRLELGGLLALGRESEEPEAGQRGREEDADDDEAIAGGHGVVPWVAGGVPVGVAKKSVMENKG